MIHYWFGVLKGIAEAVKIVVLPLAIPTLVVLWATRRRKSPFPGVRVGAEVWHMGYDHGITWFSEKTSSVMGFHSRKPVVGDLLMVPMESGRIGYYVFTELRPQLDPHDMFFATVKPTGVYNWPENDGQLARLYAWINRGEVLR
jgi:hypothetical protein